MFILFIYCVPDAFYKLSHSNFIATLNIRYSYSHYVEEKPETQRDCNLAKTYYKYVVELGLQSWFGWLQSPCSLCYNMLPSKKVDFKRLKWASKKVSHYHKNSTLLYNSGEPAFILTLNLCITSNLSLVCWILSDW